MRDRSSAKGRMMATALREKNGKLNKMPSHHNLEEYPDEYIESVHIAGDRKAGNQGTDEPN